MKLENEKNDPLSSSSRVISERSLTGSSQRHRFYFSSSFHHLSVSSSVLPIAFHVVDRLAISIVVGGSSMIISLQFYFFRIPILGTYCE